MSQYSYLDSASRIQDGLYVGPGLVFHSHYKEVRDQWGIEAVLNLSKSIQPQFVAPEILYLKLHAPDTEEIPIELLIPGVEFIHQCQKNQRPLLVHCMAGRNRSPTFIMAYLVTTGKTFQEAFSWVKTAHPITRRELFLLNDFNMHPLLEHFHQPAELWNGKDLPDN
ncbi:MAG: dual specificity protein phosphatase family protein [SAR324 cluster bacterium]|nr:dual specificity protein phosphatase family protein [SAR324 cluster bacterium]